MRGLAIGRPIRRRLPIPRFPQSEISDRPARPARRRRHALPSASWRLQLTDFADLAADLNPSRPRRVVEYLEMPGPTHSIELESTPIPRSLTLQYRAGTKPCLFTSAFSFDGRTIRLRDGSALPAGRVDVAYSTLDDAQ